MEGEEVEEEGVGSEEAGAAMGCEASTPCPRLFPGWAPGPVIHLTTVEPRGPQSPASRV